MEDTDVKGSHFSNLVLILLIFVLLIPLYGKIYHISIEYLNWDLHEYIKMAEAFPRLASDIEFPYGYRILGPYLAGLLPFDIPTSFYVLTLICAFIFILIFYFLIIKSGIKPDIACLITILFTINWYVFGFFIWNYFQLNDLLSMLFTLIAILSLIDNRYWAFGIVMILGALTRETTLVMIPVGIIYLLENHRNRSVLMKLIIMSIPAITVFIGLRILIQLDGDVNLLRSFSRHWHKLISPGAWYQTLIITFAPLSLLPVIAWRETISFFIDRKYAVVFVALIFLSSLFGSNISRLLAPVSIFFYLFIAYTLNRQLRSGKYSYTAIVVTAIISSLPNILSQTYPMSLTAKLVIPGMACLIIAILLYFKFNRAQGEEV